MWRVHFTKKADKQFRKLPQGVQEQVSALALEIEKLGPVRGNWPNYSKLGDGDAGTHEKAPY